jgi:peptidyl-prolyl cis-trans isomerase D
VRSELEADYRREQAQTKFYELSQQLADETFAALTELDSVAQKLGLTVQTLRGFTRAGVAPFAGEKAVIDAAFSSDVLEQRQNSQPVQIGEDRVVVLRVTDHKQPEQRPLDAVSGDIEASLRASSAHDAARGAADAAAKRVEAGASLKEALTGLPDVAPQRTTLQRTDTTLPAELVSAVFAAARPEGGRPVAGSAALTSGDAAVFRHRRRPSRLAAGRGGCDRNGPAAPAGGAALRCNRDGCLSGGSRAYGEDHAQREGVRVRPRFRAESAPRGR